MFCSRKNSKKTGQETRSILDAAYADSGLALDFYTGFDAEWNDPASPVQVFPGFVEFLSFSELGDQGGTVTKNSCGPWFPTFPGGNFEAIFCCFCRYLLCL